MIDTYTMNERLVISWMKCINLKFSLKCLTGMFSPFPFSSMPRHRIPKLHYTCVVLQISLEWLFTVTTTQKKSKICPLVFKLFCLNKLTVWGKHRPASQQLEWVSGTPPGYTILSNPFSNIRACFLFRFLTFPARTAD